MPKLLRNSTWKRLAAIVSPFLALLGFAFYYIAAEVRQARVQATVTVNALGEHARMVLSGVELIIDQIDGLLGNTPMTELGDRRDIHDHLQRLRSRGSGIESIFLVDRSGRVVLSSRAFPMPAYDVRDREYMSAFGTQKLHISAPFIGQMDRTWAFTASRARRLGEASDGLIAVTLTPRYFEGFYRSTTDAQGQSAAILVRTDGAILVRAPAPPVSKLKLLDNSPLLAAARERVAGSHWARSTIDGRVRASAFRRLDDYGLIANFNLDAHPLIVRWVLTLGLLTGLATALSYFIVRSLRDSDHRTAQERAALEERVREAQERADLEVALQQTRRSEALGQLVGGVAHDFNNLLAVIKSSHVIIAAKVNTDSAAQRMLAAAEQAVDRGAALTQRLLAFARQQDLHPTLVNVAELLRNMSTLIERTLGPQMETTWDLGELPPVRVDAGQLELAVLNLVANARDAMAGSGRVTIAARTEQVAESGRLPEGLYVAVEIQDEGHGMDQQTLIRATEPFFTTKDVGKGTGLGLSMVQGFAEQSGGRLSLRSMPGSGTTASILLPAAAGEISTAPAVDATPLDVRPMRILIVDDDPLVAMGTRAMLEDLGHTVVQAASGKAALAELEAGAPVDLVITDQAMPGMTGTELAERIGQLRPGLAVVLATGYADLSNVPPGVCKLAKPFSQSELARALMSATKSASA